MTRNRLCEMLVAGKSPHHECTLLVITQDILGYIIPRQHKLSIQTYIIEHPSDLEQHRQDRAFALNNVVKVVCKIVQTTVWLVISSLWESAIAQVEAEQSCHAFSTGFSEL